MGVNNLAEYVKYHQQKLREQDTRSASTSTAPTSQSTSTSTNRKKKGGVNHVHSASSYKTSVVEGSSGKLVVVDFFATWCGPCKAIAPTIANWSNEPGYEGKVDFVKIDVDQVPEVAQEEGIRAMPTFKIYKDGQSVAEVVGANPQALRAKIDSLLKSIENGTPIPPFVKTAEPFNIMSYVPYLLLAYLLYNYFFAAK